MTTTTTQGSAMRLMAAIAFGLLAVAAGAQSWTFDGGAEGWQVNDLTGGSDWVTSHGVSPVTWNPGGGVSGGYISAVDPSDFTFTFEKTGLGDYSSFIGGTLDFSLRSTGSSWTVDNVVVFRGGAVNQILVTEIGSLPGVNWTDYALTLTADRFRYDSKGGAVASASDFATVMGNLTAVRISAEYVTSPPYETTGLDRVSFVAIPEPATTAVAFGVAALVGAVWLRRRRAG